MFQQLLPQLYKYLPEAKNVYIATALIKDYGYQIIERFLPQNAKRYYLIGLNLPSDASVFEQMLTVPEERGQTRIFLDNQTFHPKVYLIERLCGTWIAFIGSANTTNGGLIGNVEMSLQTEERETCAALHDWFENHYRKGGELTPNFVDAWRRTTSRINTRQATNRSDITAIRSHLVVPVNVDPKPSCNAGQFFKGDHYLAYDKVNWYDYSGAANKRRKQVWLQLAELDSRIYDAFSIYGLDNLYPHYHKASRISHYQYRRGFSNSEQKSIWLHYGYPQKKLNKDFNNHPRMQVILQHDSIGIWLVVGINNGSQIERERFKKELTTNLAFASLVFRLMADLGDSYWLAINGKEEKYLNSYPTAEALRVQLIQDDSTHYLIVGRTWSLNAPELADPIIAESVLEEFKRLYPLYMLYL